MADESEGTFKRFWQSPIAATLITVLGTAVVGNLVAAGVQDRSKRNEIALTAFRDNQTAQVGVVKEIYDLIGKYTAAGSDLVWITRDQFADENFSPEDAKLNHQWFHNVRDKHDEIDATWRQKKYSLGYLLAFHYHGRQGISESWHEVVKAVDAFDECVGEQAQQAPGSQQFTVSPCQSKADVVDGKVANLTQSLEAGSAPMWEELYQKNGWRCLWLFC